MDHFNILKETTDFLQEKGIEVNNVNWCEPDWCNRDFNYVLEFNYNNKKYNIFKTCSKDYNPKSTSDVANKCPVNGVFNRKWTCLVNDNYFLPMYKSFKLLEIVKIVTNTI